MVARLVSGLLCACWALILLGVAAHAQEPTIPLFWSARERFPQPDLSALPRLRFLTTADFPPFNSLDGSGRLVGFNIDLARAVCAELGMAAKCEIQALPWGELRGALQAGKGEAIIAGIAVTAENRGIFAFSRSYLRFPGRFVMRKTEARDEPLWKALEGKTVGVPSGSAHQRFLHDAFRAATAKPYADVPTMLDDLAEGRIDAVFGDGMRLSFWLGADEGAQCCRFAGGPYLAPDYFGPGLAIAVRRDDRALAEAFDYALHAVGTGSKFTELYLRWFPVGFF